MKRQMPNLFLSWPLILSLLLATPVFGQPAAVQAGKAIRAKAVADPKYKFTRDFTTGHTGKWERLLAPIKGKPNVHGLEIGCFEGRSTIWLLENIFTHPTSSMTCIDPFDAEKEARFDHNIKVSGYSARLKKVKGYSQEALRTMKRDSFDFIYIDGCHRASCVLTDAVMSWDLAKTGAIIIFDDYRWMLEKYPPAERPKLAVDAFIEAYIDQLRVLQLAGQAVVRKQQGWKQEFLTSHRHVRKANRKSAGGRGQKAAAAAAASAK